VYAFDARNGKQLWGAETDGPVLSSPVILDKKVYVGASDGKFRALNVKDGSAVWTFSDVKGFVECRPYIDGEQVVFGTWENRMYSLDPQTGRLQWEWKREKGSRMYSPAACNPVKAGGKIFFAAPDRKVYALDAKTGKQLKTFEGGREAVGVSQDGRTVYSKSMHNKAYAIDLEAMEKKWEVVSGLGYDISPTDIAEFEGLVYLPTDKGNIITFDAKTGDRVWAHKISLALVNPLVIVKDKDVTKVLVSCMDGVVALLELQK
jgi:outer membrane protein assembly factor BamB